MGFSRQEHWSALPFPPPRDLLDPGIKPVSCASRITGRFFITSATWEAPVSWFAAKRTIVKAENGSGNKSKVTGKNLDVHVRFSPGAESLEFAPWVDPESQVFKSSVKGKHCLEDEVSRRREELSWVVSPRRARLFQKNVVSVACIISWQLKKPAVLASRALFRWRVHLGFLPHVPPLTTTAALYSSLQVAMFTHQRQKASPVCASNGQRTLSMVPPHNNGVQVLRGKMCASLDFEHLILNKIFFVHTLAFIRWFLQLYYSNHVTGSLILCRITVS